MAIAYINEGYVHSNIEHVKWDYTAKIFNTKGKYIINNNLTNLMSRYRKSLSQIIEIQDMETKEKIDFIADMDDSTIELIFQKLADQLTDKVDKNLISNFSDAELLARQSAGVFSNGFDNKQFSKLMNAIAAALKQINALNQSRWKTFAAQYKLMMNGRSDSKKLAEDIKELNGLVGNIKDGPMKQIMSTLMNIPNNMLKNGNMNYSAEQMTGTLNDIFDTKIGEYTAFVLQDMVLDVEEEITKQFVKQGGNKAGQITVPSQNVRAKRPVPAKIDIVRNAETQITLDINKKQEKQYSISGQFASSVKWYKDKKSTPSSVSIQSISSLTQLALQIYKNEYAVYNTLAFYKENHPIKESNFRIIRSSVIANYLDKFIAGSNSQLKTGDQDTALFLFINGKFYSIYSILLAYLKDIEKKKMNYGSSSDLFYMNLGEIDNSWQGDMNVSNEMEARKRSLLAKKSIQKFAVNIKLNLKTLQLLTAKNNIPPLI